MVSDCKRTTLDPNNPTGPKISVIFPAGYMVRLYKYSPVDFQNLRAADYVLGHPQRIFFGVRLLNQGGWCYTGRPVEWCIREGCIVPFPKDKVFAVYINPNMQVYECRAEYAAHDDPLCPVDWQERYRGLTWKSTS